MWSLQTCSAKISRPKVGALAFALALALLNTSAPAAKPALIPNANAFRFDLQTDDILIVDKYQDIRVRDRRGWQSREEKNRIVLKVVGREADAAVLAGSFHTYSRSPRAVGEFRRDRDFQSKFKIRDNGHYEVADTYVMPNLRDLPAFPDRPLKIGESWEDTAVETMDFGPAKVKIPIKVRYRYTGPAPLTLPGGKEATYDRFEYTYSFQKATRGAVQSQAGIQSISGTSACELWFDREAGVPVFDSNRLIYNFQLIDGSSREMLYRIDSFYRKTRRTTEAQRGQIASDIRSDLKDLSESDALPAGDPGVNTAPQSLSVRESDEGVVLTLDAILFDHNSAVLSPEAKSQLKLVERILKKHSKREIRVSGHTDNTGSQVYNQTLSENRARAVVRELQKNHGVDGRRLSYRGYGENQPIVGNDTPDNRRKNRRVEILIVTE
ncbi:MAG: OmpA family protein [bacterium]|nr:OmpA family protein [bacterium]